MEGVWKRVGKVRGSHFRVGWVTEDPLSSKWPLTYQPTHGEGGVENKTLTVLYPVRSVLKLKRELFPLQRGLLSLQNKKETLRFL